MYDKNIDKKWQDRWYESDIYKAIDFDKRPKYYGLIEFPYPSGIGLHLGHVKAYIGMDVVCRKKRLEGYNVLFPIGWDSFGLPTENYAIKTGVHPRIVTDKNIVKFTQQAKTCGFSFDFSRQVDTTDPKYYKWTQWIFLQLFKKGLAYKANTEVNYCNNCQVVLSNEESQGGKCDRCGGEVVQKSKEVWMLKITDYAEKLLEGLNTVDFPDKIKAQQENWIGKSTGAEVNFELNEVVDSLKVYTTRPDTIFGVTFMVIAPEHPLVEKYANNIENIEEIRKYRNEAKKKTEFERVQIAKDKTGVVINGLTVKNPITKKNIPVWVSDYVMMGYGTGAIMAVPAHDDRDFAFAKKFDIDIMQVITNGDNINILEAPYTDIYSGYMMNSDFLNDKPVKEAIEFMNDYVENKGLGKKKTNYFMKDWAFARQRYWGEPVPIVKCAKCGLVPLDEKDLPLVLPEVKDFKPGVGGESPLATIDSWTHTICPKCGGSALRETDTMPQWAGSSWYYLRYTDPNNDKELADSDKMKYWLPVDCYSGGMEHVTRHLIYSRFWHHFLYDIGIVPTTEPYAKRTTQGLILGCDGEKMSKSRGNIVDPNDIIAEYGSDSLRTYMLFICEYGDTAPWSDNGLKGAKKFLDKVINLSKMVVDGYPKEIETNMKYEINRLIKKVTSDYDNMKYNTAIAAFMTYINVVYKATMISTEDLRKFLIMLSPVAPHVAQEVWSTCIDEHFIEKTGKWPQCDESAMQQDKIEIAVQVNGNVKFKLIYDSDMPLKQLEQLITMDERLQNYIKDKQIKKIIVIPGRIANVVV